MSPQKPSEPKWANQGSDQTTRHSGGVAVRLREKARQADNTASGHRAHAEGSAAEYQEGRASAYADAARLVEAALQSSRQDTGEPWRVLSDDEVDAIDRSDDLRWAISLTGGRERIYGPDTPAGIGSYIAVVPEGASLSSNPTDPTSTQDAPSVGDQSLAAHERDTARADWLHVSGELKELRDALRTLASRCESEAIEAAGDLAALSGGPRRPMTAGALVGRKAAFNTVECWIDEMLKGEDDAPA